MRILLFHALIQTTYTEDPIDDGAVIYALAWPQGVGCAIMGLALARRNELITMCVLRLAKPVLNLTLLLSYPPVYTFLTTGKLFPPPSSSRSYRCSGLAGSVTTFSTWIIEGYVAFANVEGSTRNAFDDVSMPRGPPFIAD